MPRPRGAEFLSPPELYLGLISGTSVDGIDAALVEFDGEWPRLVRGDTHPYPEALREELLAVSQADGAITLEAFGALDQRVGLEFARAASRTLEAGGLVASDVAAIGSHGQTLCHRPHGAHPFTLQIGDPNVIAEVAGIRTVADFRRRDVAAGGQGAPLLPALHATLFADPGSDVAVLNLGGIANLTLLPRAGTVRGFDTGPANCLLDAWISAHAGTGRDEGGHWAAAGKVDAELLERLSADPYFMKPAPKSTGRDYFHLGWLRTQLRDWIGDPRDVQATLLELSASSIVAALRSELPAASRLIACGGGVHNPALMQRLRGLAAPIEVSTTAAFGVDPDFVEAAGFAWLARATLMNVAGNLPSVTGARGPRILGGVFAA